MPRRLPSPESETRRMTAAARVERALASLADDEKAAICVVDFAGGDLWDAGARMGLPPEVAESARARGLRRLARLLGSR